MIPGRHRQLAGVAAIAIVGASDRLQSLTRPPLPAAAALDWIAHVATASLLAPAARTRRERLLTAVAAVGIDVDHAPTYLARRSRVGRPPTHSLLGVAALAAGAAVGPACRRREVGMLAGGLLVHLVRDVATGPGAPLLWPLSRRAVRVPYALYLGVLAGAATYSPSRDH